MRFSVLILSVSLLGCGREVVEGEQGGGATDPVAVRNAALSSTLSSYLKAVTSGDAELVLAVLSAERLARVEKVGGIGRVLEEQAGQVRRAFGEDADFSQGVEVQRVDAFESDKVLAVTLSYRGQALPKRIWYVLEGSQYKLNLVPPKQSASSSPGTLRQSLVTYESEYGVMNQYAENSGSSENFRYRATSGPGYSPAITLNAPPSFPASASVTVFADNCTNVFLDGTDFQGTNGGGAFWQLPVRCAQQIFGTLEFRLRNGDTLWTCIQTCT